MYYDFQMARIDPQVNLRIPYALKVDLEKQSKLNGRSLTAEIVARLQESFVHPSGPGEKDNKAVEALSAKIDEAFNPERMQEFLAKALSSIGVVAIPAGTGKLSDVRRRLQEGREVIISDRSDDANDDPISPDKEVSEPSKKYPLT